MMGVSDVADAVPEGPVGFVVGVTEVGCGACVACVGLSVGAAELTGVIVVGSAVVVGMSVGCVGCVVVVGVAVSMTGLAVGCGACVACEGRAVGEMLGRDVGELVASLRHKRSPR